MKMKIYELTDSSDRLVAVNLDAISHVVMQANSEYTEIHLRTPTEKGHVVITTKEGYHEIIQAAGRE
jgi:hypothetical protein